MWNFVSELYSENLTRCCKFITANLTVKPCMCKLFWPMTKLAYLMRWAWEHPGQDFLLHKVNYSLISNNWEWTWGDFMESLYKHICIWIRIISLKKLMDIGQCVPTLLHSTIFTCTQPKPARTWLVKSLQPERFLYQKSFPFPEILHSYADIFKEMIGPVPVLSVVYFVCSQTDCTTY